LCVALALISSVEDSDVSTESLPSIECSSNEMTPKQSRTDTNKRPLV